MHAPGVGAVWDSGLYPRAGWGGQHSYPLPLIYAIVPKGRTEHLSFPLTPTIGYRVMTTVPTIPSSQAPKPQHSPPTVEEHCLRTFKSCWHLDKGWLISFIVLAQCMMPTSTIIWVKFMLQGHTHLVYSALKLVLLTKALLIAKIKEVMLA